jgi:hypothetical protein
MKKALDIVWRLLKVIYVALLFLGLGVGWLAWIGDQPYTDYTYGNYLVTCDNGKTFDPTSKPIQRTTYTYVPDSFDDQSVKAECKFGTAYWYGTGNELDHVTYNLTYQTYPHVILSGNDQIKATIISVAIYYLLLEIIRRTFLYICFGRKFLTLGKI